MPSSIFCGTATAASVAAGGVLPLASIFRRQCGCVNQLNSDSIVLERAGYYKVVATVTFSAPAAGVVTMALNKNSEQVAGMTASTTITTANTEIRSLTISGIVKVGCCNGAASLQLVNQGVAIDTSNITIDVVYLG